MSNEKSIPISKIQAFQRQFVSERDWDQFHSPKNLVMALAGEAGELVEIFQWLNEKESHEIMNDSKKSLAVRNELADIFYYLLRLSDKLNVDLEAAFWEKMKQNESRYPVSLSKGSSKKYNELKGEA